MTWCPHPREHLYKIRWASLSRWTTESFSIRPESCPGQPWNIQGLQNAPNRQFLIQLNKSRHHVVWQLFVSIRREVRWVPRIMDRIAENAWYLRTLAILCLQTKWLDSKVEVKRDMALRFYWTFINIPGVRTTIFEQHTLTYQWVGCLSIPIYRSLSRMWDLAMANNARYPM